MSVVRIIVAATLLVATGLYLKHQPRLSGDYSITVVPPTCEEHGYSLYTDTSSGATEIRELVAALGHSFVDEELIQETGEVEPQYLRRICRTCGKEEVQVTYPKTSIARLSLYGSLDGIGKTSEVPLDAEFVGEGIEFQGYTSLKYQGHESLSYEKKNYTIKFYLDEQHEKKNKLVFNHWRPEHKYILKANAIDPSQCRNLVCADVWADMVKSRGSGTMQLKNLSNYGAVDGFPVALYINDEFGGLYTMNLHKDDDLFGMEDGRDQAIMIINRSDKGESLFREEAAFTELGAWEVEYCGTSDTTWAKTRINELIHFVCDSNDEAFRRDLSQWLDVDSAIDYLIAMYALGLEAHGAEDLILVTYGKNTPWICSLYDMEDAFSSPGNMAESLLWERLQDVFFPEICQRYAQLRQTILSPEMLCARVEAFTAKIPIAFYEADAKINHIAMYTTEEAKMLQEQIWRCVTEADTRFHYAEKVR